MKNLHESNMMNGTTRTEPVNGIIKFLYSGNKKAQSTMETAILVFVVVVALVCMQIYLKRGIQGRLRSGVDSIGGQYDYNATSSEYMTNHVSDTTTVSTTATVPVTTSGVTANVTLSDTTVITNYDNTYKNGYEIVDKP
jgi:hypothetical protein